MTLIETLEKFSNACGVAGREDEVRILMKKLLANYVDEVREDRLGNVIGVKRGGGKNPLKVMLAAHMDEIGLLVKTISKDGFIQFTKMGGIDDRILLAQKVLIHTDKGSIPGVIGCKPPHIQKEEERKKVISYDELFIDIGAESLEEAKQMGVKIGDPVSFDVKFVKAGKDAVMGKAFDDRVGCAVLVEAVKQLEEVDCTVYVVGTVQEELGLRGAATAAFGIYPDVGIALDVTIAGDAPGVKEFEAPVKLRKGPSITVADYGLVTHPKVLRLLVDAAEGDGIPYQLESGLPGATDAARISLTREGVPSGVISIPTRYIHSPVSLISLKDAENAVKLVVSAVRKIPEYF
ncbi:M42 family metallopeptidase [Candidatus Bathyarchaeota archaeon]|nr:M42 family metallopeptidase [Candidatus Bathyarchaeota archaeon]